MAFDYIRIDASYSFDSDPMPTLVVVDVLHGAIEYVRDGMADRVRDGDSVLVSGWDMAFSGVGDFPELRTTSLPAAGLLAAIEEADPDFGERIIFTSYVPHSPAAGARWRATVDQISSMLPDNATPSRRRRPRASWATPSSTRSPTTSSSAPRCPGPTTTPRTTHPPPCAARPASSRPTRRRS